MISARPPEKQVHRGEVLDDPHGSSELSTVTALDSRVSSVLTAAAPRITAGEEWTKSGPVVLTDAEHIEPNLLGELELLHQNRAPAPAAI